MPRFGVRRDPPSKVPSWWALVAALAAPVLLDGGFELAAARQPASYDPVHDTISSLAAQGAADPWIMTTAMVAVAACYLLVAVGLHGLRLASRLALGASGLATLVIAVARQPRHGFSDWHALAVALAAVAMCAFPILAATWRPERRVASSRSFVVAAIAVTGLTLWFFVEQHHADVGLAERVATTADALCPSVVVVSLRRASSTGVEAVPLVEDDGRA